MIGEMSLSRQPRQKKASTFLGYHESDEDVFVHNMCSREVVSLETWSGERQGESMNDWGRIGEMLMISQG